jgi:DNA-binding YbaB/EbfC family protein
MGFNFLKLLNSNKIQEMIQKKQQEFEKITVTGESGAGMVKITANMRHYIQALDIKEEFFKEDYSDLEFKEVLSELIITAHNQVTQKIEQRTKEKMMSMENIGDMFSGEGAGGADFFKSIFNPSKSDNIDASPKDDNHKK